MNELLLTWPVVKLFFKESYSYIFGGGWELEQAPTLSFMKNKLCKEAVEMMVGGGGRDMNSVNNKFNEQ